jgi:hypothetical protein
MFCSAVAKDISPKEATEQQQMMTAKKLLKYR